MISYKISFQDEFEDETPFEKLSDRAIIRMEKCRMYIAHVDANRYQII